MTGHLVFSTLHTNDAASAVTRLIDMGIEPYLISSSILAVMAQRLVRVICPHCKVKDDDAPLAGCLHDYPRLKADHATPYKGRGCDDCMQTGFHGRSGIFELLPVDDQIRHLITDRSPSHVIRRAAIDQGMVTLREDGLAKALEGRTTVEEVLRVTQDVLLATGDR
jgi:general secretion pathway protein E